MTVTLLDVIMVAILALCFILGFWNGLTKQLATILGIVAGVVVAARLAPRFAETVTGRFIADPNGARIAAYLILFLGAALAVWIAGRIVRTLIRKAELGSTDRMWGAGFGLLKGVVFCWALLLAIVPMHDQSYFKRQLEESYIAPRLLVGLNVAGGAFPAGLKQNLKHTVDRWKARLKKEGGRLRPRARTVRRDFR